MKSIQLLVLSFALLTFLSCGEEKTNQGTKQVSITIGIPIDHFLATYLISTNREMYTVAMQNYHSATKSTFNIARFVKAFEKSFPDEAIVKLFDLNKSPGLKIGFSNSQVQNYLEKACDSTLLAIQKQLEHRISRMTSGMPNFVIDTKKGQIEVQINEIKNVEAVIHAIQANVKLEFYETFSIDEYIGDMEFVLNECDDVLTSNFDSTTQLSNIPSIRSMMVTDGYTFGNVAPENQQKVMNVLQHPDVMQLLPEDLELMWGSFPNDFGNVKGMYTLYPIKLGDYVRISSDDIAEAKPGLTEGNRYTVNLTLKEEAIERWEKMTGNNIGKSIAMTLDNKVLSAPRVSGQISDGVTEISGSFSMDEAKELAAIINAGSYKIPIIIISVK